MLEGQAKIMEADNTAAGKLSDALREVYRGISGEHPDWDEYDRAMVEEHRRVVHFYSDPPVQFYSALEQRCALASGPHTRRC